MRRLLAIALLLSWAAVARAQTPGVHVSWSECLPKGGLQNVDFTCDTNDGAETLVLAVSPAVSMSQVVGFEARIDLHAGLACPGPGCTSPLMPSWWQFQTGGCRASHLFMTNDFTLPPFSIGSACRSPWKPNSGYGFDYGYPSSFVGGDPSIAVLRAVAAVPASTPMTLTPGTEYYVLRFTIDHGGTVGLPPATCEGCCTPLWIVPASITIVQPVGVGDFVLTGTEADIITWQSHSICGPTAARRASWGMVKSLYR